MLSEDNKVWSLINIKNYIFSIYITFIINADLECLIEKTDGCKNNPGNLSRRKVGE